MGKDRVLIVGETKEAAVDVRRRLFEAAGQTVPPGDAPARLTIATKYFTVRVEVCAAARAAVAAAERAGVDALVLSDPACAPAGLDPLLAAFDEPPGVVLVCCACAARGLDDAAVEALRVWCLDHEAELVDMGLPTLSEREKEGIDRVFEALASHPWQSPDEVSAAAAATAATAVKEKVEVEVPARTRACGAALGDADDTRSLDELCETLAGGTGLGEDDELESEDFFRLMESLAKMRDTAQKLPDAQRRLYAERVAMAFARQLAFDDEEEEDGSSEKEGAPKTQV